MTDEIEVRLYGEGISPGLVRSHELAEILEAIEDFVVAETLRRDPSATRDEIIVGLLQVADRSLGLRFKASLASVAIPAFIAGSQAIAAGQFHELSPHSLKPLQVLAGFSRRHNATAELKLPERDAPLVTIAPETVIPEQTRITGATEMTAKVLRVGGKVPRAMLELLDGTVIYCDLPIELARELGHRLYDVATLTGVATWNAATLDVEEFTISSLTEFPERDPSETFRDLRKLIGPQLEQLGDVLSLVTRLRQVGDEE
jgi:hypothetical protein